MAKVFSENKGKSPRPLRNGYDHSFQNLLTGNYGYIYPINVEELNPGESIKIQDTVSVRSHPVVFPVSTRIKAYVHYFAVRNRILVKDWENFINGLDPNAKLPYLKYTEQQAKRLMKTGSLFDYLGGPTTVAGEFPVSFSFDVSKLFSIGFKDSDVTISSILSLYNDNPSFFEDVLINSWNRRIVDNPAVNSILNVSLLKLPKGTINVGDVIKGIEFISGTPASISSGIFLVPVILDSSNSIVAYDVSVASSALNIPYVDDHYEISVPSSINSFFENNHSLGDCAIFFIPSFLGNTTSPTLSNAISPFFNVPGSTAIRSIFFPASLSYRRDRVIESVDDIFISQNRYISHDGADPVEPLTSLYHRAYEMVYNYYYRNSQNNPYNPTGNKVEYNKFIPSDDSGWDSNEYELRRRNWELDAYTSAVPSPQFGDAPLIGITYTGGDTADFTFEVTDEQQNVQKVKATMRVDPDTGILSGVQSFDESVPSGNIRNLMDLSTYGISINAIRNANAFQLFKEDTLQHPLRYRDQIYAHWGVNVDYPDVDVPEFIGGTSADLVVSQVTNMSESDNAPLGDIAGKIDAVFNFKHPVKYHAKEHTIILGVISIVPVPTYSQLCPKRFLRHSMFDFYQRRFGKIGYVPIFRSEIMPLQSQDPDEVFGYQRAWYEYMSRVNEVHGDFRTSLSDFVIMRQFKDEPQLNEDFTVVDPDSVTNIFATDKIQDKYGSSDKFMIQVYHDTSYISVIPKFGRASLE